MNGDLLTEFLNDILTCACSSLHSVCDISTDCGCPCRMFISAGPPVQDLEACCSTGQLSVHIGRIYPVGNFPQQAMGVNLCQVQLAAEVVVTLFRCWPAVIRDDGSAPTGPEIEVASTSLYKDLYLLTRGLLCCLSSKARRQQFVFQSGTIVPPSGGCSGVEVKFSIELNDPLP